MPAYSYRARNGAGELIHGSMDANNRDELASKLRRMGYMPTQIKVAILDFKFDFLWDSFRSVRTEPMMIWIFQLSNLIGAGINVLTALRVVRDQTDDSYLRSITDDIVHNIDAGDGFSEALARHPRVFSKLFVSMVQAGEASGKLEEVMTSYAIYSEKQADLKQKVRSALLYPMILLIAGIAIVMYVVVAIIPQFVEVFVQAGVDLPLPTQVIYQWGNLMQQHWLSGILILGTLIVAKAIYGSTPMGRYHLDRFKLRLPFFGTLFRRTAITRFTRTLGTLVASGVPILQSLDTSRGVLGNAVIEKAIQDTRKSVEKGNRISVSLKNVKEFPVDVVQMIAAGEESGTLDQMLLKISDFYDRFLAYAFKRLTTVFEPLLLSVLGAMVGFIMLSTLLPMLDMITVLRR